MISAKSQQLGLWTSKIFQNIRNRSFRNTLLGCPRKFVKGEDLWVITPTYPIYKQVIPNLRTIGAWILTSDPAHLAVIKVSIFFHFFVHLGVCHSVTWHPLDTYAMPSQLPIHRVMIDPWFQIDRELEDEDVYGWLMYFFGVFGGWARKDTTFWF